MLEKPDNNVLRAMASLSDNMMFMTYIAWKRKNLETLRKAGDKILDEVQLRWRQGACQALDDDITFCESANESLRAKGAL